MAELTKNAKPIDVVTVFEELRARKQDVEVGGLQYLVSLSNATPSAANIRRYAEIVRDRSILRQLVSVGEKIATSALAPQTGRSVRLPVPVSFFFLMFAIFGDDL